MERNVGGYDRLARAVVAVLAAVLAVRALARGKRTVGLVAGLSALALGFNATTGVCGLNAALGVDTTAEE